MKNRFEIKGQYLIGNDPAKKATEFILTNEFPFFIINEDGLPNYTVDTSGSEAVISEISDRSTIDLSVLGQIGNDYKKRKRDDLRDYIRDNYATEITKDVADIRSQWASFRSAVLSATTKGEVDSLFDSAYAWLTS